MVLNDIAIRKAVENGVVDIQMSEKGVTADGILHQINPNSMDLTISSRFKRPVIYRYSDEIRYGEAASRDLYRSECKNDIVMEPGDCILGVTREYVRIPNDIYAQLFIKSSLGRCFVNHLMAGVVDAGFHGRLTLELKNDGLHKVVIPAGSRICQLVFFELNAEAELGYSEKGDSRYFGYESAIIPIGEKDIE